MTPPAIDLSFPHAWTAEILPARPLILPPRHYVYPRDAEEVERGALEVLIKPLANDEPQPSALDEPEPSALKGHGFRRAANPPSRTGALAPEGSSSPLDPFLATCALGFRDPLVPTGLWSAPNPHEICAVSGGYAYLIDTTAPQRFTMIPCRPVLEVRPVAASRLLLFVGHNSILAWGRNGQAWESGKLSDEGITITAMEDGMLRGFGWEMMSDKDTPFVLDLHTGQRAT